MAPAQNGDKVKVHYTGTLEDGSQFDSSRERDQPMEFTIGKRELLQGFENAVVGLELNESRSVSLTAEEAYGAHDPSQIIEMPRTQIPSELKLEIGLRLQGQRPKGETVLFSVVAINETSVTLDSNHPLAGKALTFEIELLEIL